MYMLRLISGVLHREVGSAVSDAARDLVPGELAVLVPLVALPARALGLAGGDLGALVPEVRARRSQQQAISGATVSAPRGFRPPRTPAVPHGSMSSEGGIMPVKIDRRRTSTG